VRSASLSQEGAKPNVTHKNVHNAKTCLHFWTFWKQVTGILLWLSVSIYMLKMFLSLSIHKQVISIKSVRSWEQELCCLHISIPLTLPLAEQRLFGRQCHWLLFVYWKMIGGQNVRMYDIFPRKLFVIKNNQCCFSCNLIKKF